MTPSATPDDVALLREAEARFRAGDGAGALRLYDKAGARSGKNADALIGAANVHLAMSNTEDARRAAQRALKLRPDSPACLTLLGRIELLRRHPNDALDLVEKALALAPDDLPALYCKGEILHILGRDAESYEHFERLLNAGVRHAGALMGFAAVAAKVDGPDKAIEICDEAVRAARGPEMRANMLHRLSKILDDMGAYEKAFDAAQRANNAARVTWDAEEASRSIRERIEAWDEATLNEMPRSTVRDQTPVFIVGMPRSGTSLVEQILDCHPEIHGAGERHDIPRVVSELQRAATDQTSARSRLLTVPAHAIQSRAEAQLRALKKLDPRAKRVTDKLPHNFLFLPEVAMLLPGARVIHCVRDPRDTCVSCYLRGLGPAHSWSTDLRDTARHYADYAALMERYEAVPPLPILRVRYEDLIDDSETVVRGMLDFLGVEFSEACLRHERSSRAVHTASAQQATKPIYASSVARYKRYGERLAPLLDELQKRGVLTADESEE